ncbi:MAG TPA: hypothetical protein DC001_02730 [Clostridiales bacterium]|nr:hypothetical protein [Clostridiales bacterium]HBR08463.1 hypothetical protein [Clostridiales bacterium]
MKKTFTLRRLLVLFSFGLCYGFMYVLPYMKSSFYDQMIAAMKCTNEQLGSLMTIYTAVLTLSYLPGGWVADKFKPKAVVLASIWGNAALCFILMFTYTNFFMVQLIWGLIALAGGFAFWPGMMKGIRMQGDDDEQGRIYGVFDAMNGFASLLLSFIMLGVMALFGSGDLVIGFKGAVGSMGIMCVIAGLFVLFLFKEDATYGDPSVEESAKKFNFHEYLSTFKLPGTWYMTAFVWCYVVISAAASYLTPYSTSVLGLSAVLAASIGTIRTYGCRMIGGPLGGFMADSWLKCVSKEQGVGNLLCIAALALFLIVPVGVSPAITVSMLIFVGITMFTTKGTYFSMQVELGVPPHISGTAIAIATLVGYLPDLFVHTMFGRWIDASGAAGYTKIFWYAIGTAAFGVVVSIFATRRAKKLNILGHFPAKV